MKNIIILVFVILFFATKSVFGQEISLKKEFSWNKIDKKDTALINEFIKSTPDEFEYYKQNDTYTPTLKDLKKALHVVDLNNDGLNDIVFDGWSGGEPREISIFLNTGTGFKKVFTDYQGIQKMQFSNGILSKLNITDWGCCGEFMITDRFYNVETKKGELHFTLITLYRYIRETKIPNSFWRRTKRIKTLNNNYNLRLKPIIDDTTKFYFGEEPSKGNVIGKIPKNTLAIAMAESVDETGRIWYFVAIPAETKMKETYFDYSKDLTKSYNCGWISSRYIEIID